MNLFLYKQRFAKCKQLFWCVYDFWFCFVESFFLFAENFILMEQSQVYQTVIKSYCKEQYIDKAIKKIQDMVQMTPFDKRNEKVQEIQK